MRSPVIPGVALQDVVIFIASEIIFPYVIRVIPAACGASGFRGDRPIATLLVMKRRDIGRHCRNEFTMSEPASASPLPCSPGRQKAEWAFMAKQGEVVSLVSNQIFMRRKRR